MEKKFFRSFVHVFIILTTVFSGSLYYAKTASQGQPAGIVSLVIGKAYVLRDDNREPLHLKDRLYESDTIVTEKGKVRVQVGDYYIFQVAENTVVRVETMKESGDQKNVSLEMNQGQIYSKIAKSKNFDMTIKTPTVTAGARGTEFLVSSQDESTEEDQQPADEMTMGNQEDEPVPSGVYVNEGVVEVASEDGEFRSNVSGGEQVVVQMGALQKQILDKYVEEKMRIFAEFDIVKEYNYRMLEDQKEKNRKMLEMFK